ncbi:MAG: EamA family transporter [Bacillota bacterium]|nr:MAG: EamA family transporter [Bacillota bacterium]
MRAYASLAAATLVWGGAFVVGRVLVAEVDPLAVAWLRFVLASAAFVPLERLEARRRSAARPAPACLSPASPCPLTWRDFALLGLTGIFAYNLFFFYGLTRTTATESSLIIACSPVVVTLLGLAFLGERLTSRKVAGILASVAGVTLIILGAAEPAGAGVGPGTTVSDRLAGDLLMLGGVVSWAAYSVLGKNVLRQVTPLAATARASYWGASLLTAAVVIRHGPSFLLRVLATTGPREVLALLYLSLVSTVFAFVAWYRGLAGTEVSRASVFLNLVPLSTLAIAAVVLAERPTWLQLAGGAGVIGGVLLVSLRGTAGTTASPPAERKRPSPRRN